MRKFLYLALSVAILLISVNLPSQAGYYRTCFPCHGSGRCSICKGAGICYRCNGEGVKVSSDGWPSYCTMCRGSGKCTAASYYHNTRDGMQMPSCDNGNCGYCGGSGQQYYPY